MTKIVTLSTGEEVSFRETFTHGDQMVFAAGSRKGVVERLVTQPDGTTVVERTPDNIDAAIEDTLFVLIESVTHNGERGKPSREWFSGLSELDYGELVQALADIRKASQEAVLAGKKNRG